MYAIVRSRANACKDESIRKYYYRAFFFKVVCAVAFAMVTDFYFQGGDTNLYYQGINDLRAALSDNFANFAHVVNSTKLDETNPLAPYFIYDNYSADITYNYMRAPSNFFVPRLGLIPSLIFFNSYLCICFCYMMFALGGAMRLFKTFYHYYPKAKREIALAILFLPSVGFWSSGLLKDTICFGAVGFLVYGVFNIFIKKTKIGISIFWVVVCSYLLFMIKTYIFLVLILALTIWIFAETNQLIKDRTLRQIFAVMTFMIGVTAGYFMLQYFTSEETLRQYQVENIIAAAESQRSNYRVIANQQTSYYAINASNPISLALNSIGATFFRPFPWEIRSLAAVLSATESLAFLILTVFLFYKKGFSRPFGAIFKDPRLLMSFIFAIVFAIGVGASTANFGTLSRYKIPCTPFYVLMVLLVYRSTNLNYPRWLGRIMGYPKT
jgi:hypothetical protein